MLGMDVIQHYLEEALILGVKEFYFTGGEPFLHPEIATVLKEALKYGPTTFLSNGTLLTEDFAQTLAQVSRISKYKFGNNSFM